MTKPLSRLEDWRLGPYTLHDKWMKDSEQFCAELRGRCNCPDCQEKRAPFVQWRTNRTPPI